MSQIAQGSDRPLSIVLEKCAKTFDDGTRALEPVDLSINGGETIVFLGPSGCGKTTTLRIIAGLEQPDAGGRVLFDGQDVTQLAIEKRNIGMVFQSYALFPNMTVAGNIGYGLRIKGWSRADIARRVSEMLALMRIEKLADRAIDQLSGGQRQRVALARALAVRPRALLLDEPLTALDARLREDLRVEIDELLRGLNITTIYVTHDQAEAMALGDRILVMQHGRVAQIGTPRDIYERPSSAFVAEFVGTMNRLKGRVQDGMFVTASGRMPWPEAPSNATQVMFRPEDVSIAVADGHLAGKVSSLFFLGDRVRLFVDVGCEQPIVIETSNRRKLARGDRIGLSVDPRSFVAIED